MKKETDLSDHKKKIKFLLGSKDLILKHLRKNLVNFLFLTAKTTSIW